ncbi:MAG: 3'-5' exonuclease [Opitutaceae bacterium]|jgi:DNA polymerase-3 subunit epsilon|nr:3'-5' exonuclease [Opitutaceae bacterium]
MRWTDTPIHFIDFEGSHASGILEFGVATLLGGRVTETRTRLCRATGRVRAEDSAVHGLRADTVAHCAPFADEFARFAALRETGPLAAHYAHVENSLLKSVWPYPRASPDFSRSEKTPGAVIDWGPWIDTGRLYAEIFPGLESGRLSSLAAASGLQEELDALAREHCPPGRARYHAALYDALAAALLLLALGRRQEFAAMSLPWLLQMSTANPAKRDTLRQDDLF